MSFANDINEMKATGWQQPFQMSGRVPLDKDSVKVTLTELQTWADAANTTAHPGKQVVVIGDGANNGLYYIDSIKDETGVASVIKKVGADPEALFVVVTSLPTTPETGNENKIHLVPLTTTGDNNKYSEYIWSGEWEKFGEFGVSVDLSAYATKESVDALSGKVKGYTDKIDKTGENGFWDKPYGKGLRPDDDGSIKVNTWADTSNILNTVPVVVTEHLDKADGTYRPAIQFDDEKFEKKDSDSKNDFGVVVGLKHGCINEDDLSDELKVSLMSSPEYDEDTGTLSFLGLRIGASEGGSGVIDAGEVSNLDNLTSDGIYRGTNGGETFIMIVVNDAASSKVMQYKFAVSRSIAYNGVVTLTRQRDNGTWTPWSIPNYQQLKSLAENVAERKLADMAEVSPEVLDTIKNIAVWMETDTTGSAQLVEDVRELQASRAYKDVTLVEGMMNSLVSEGLYRILGTTTEGIGYNLPEGVTGTINALVEVLDASTSSSAASITQKLTLSNNGKGEVYIRTATGSMASLVWEAWRTLGTGNVEMPANINERIRDNTQSAAYAIQSLMKIPFPVKGYISYADGTIKESGDTSSTTPYIPVDGVSGIYTSSVISPSGAKIAFYNSNLEFLKDISISGADANTDYEFTEEQKAASYFRVSYYGTTQSNKLEREVLFLRFSDERFSVESFSKDLESMKSKIFDLRLNSEGYSFTDYFDLSTGNLSQYYLHQTPLKAGETILFNFIKSDAKLSLSVIYKGSSKSIVIATDVREGEIVEFTPEIDVDYFGYYLFKVEGNTNAEVSVKILTKRAQDVLTLADKPTLNFLIFGDSITQSNEITYKSIEEPYSISVGGFTGTNWTTQLYNTKKLNNNFRLGEIRNYAKSGASFRDRSLDARQFLGFQIDEAFADLNAPSDGYYYGKEFTPDVIIVSIGTNDGSPSSTDTYEQAMNKTIMKTVGDSLLIDIEATLNNLDVNNYIGDAIRHSFMRLRDTFPNALCIYATPIQRSAYETPQNQLELFTSLAERYNFFVADCNKESGIVRDLQTWDGSSGDLKDGLHPTENGSKKILRCIMNKVINNIQYL